MKLKLDKQFKKNLVVIFVVGLLTAGSLEVFTHYYSFMVSRREHRCLPWNYFVIKKGVVPGEHEDLISFRGENIPRYKNGVRFIKMIAGLPGDVIKVEVFSEDRRNQHKRVIEKDHKLITQRVQGRVHIQRKDNNKTVSLDVIETDSFGQKLPVYSQEEVIPEGKYFVVGLMPRTYDSRYWGLIDKKQVIGKAYPLAFWKNTKGLL